MHYYSTLSDGPTSLTIYLLFFYIIFIYMICIYVFHNRVRDTCCMTIIIVTITSADGSSPFFFLYIYPCPTAAICSVCVPPLQTFVLVICLLLLYPSIRCHHLSCFEYFLSFLCKYMIVPPPPPILLFFYQVIYNYCCSLLYCFYCECADI